MPYYLYPGGAIGKDQAEGYGQTKGAQNVDPNGIGGYIGDPQVPCAHLPVELVQDQTVRYQSRRKEGIEAQYQQPLIEELPYDIPLGGSYGSFDADFVIS